MKEAAYQLAAIIVALTVLVGGLMALESAAVRSNGAYAMDLQRITMAAYRHQIDRKNLPRPEWPRPF